jgi:peptidoglycan pentaglycine glycine transferase (the first glycine)
VGELRPAIPAAMAWNSLIAELPGAHVLQTWEWGQIKASYGWQPWLLIWLSDGSFQVCRQANGGLQLPREKVAAAALMLQRNARLPGLRLPLKVFYIPKGPLLDWGDDSLCWRVFEDLHDIAQQQGAIFIKIDPDVPLGWGYAGAAGARDNPSGQTVTDGLAARGWNFSSEQVQFRNTVLLDLGDSEENLLAKMKQKTRYNIRLAERKGVKVRLGGEQDLELLYQMYAETSVRDGFVIREQEYYRTVWSTFIKVGMAQALIAEVDGKALAGIMLFTFARRAWYLYGMSSHRQREMMPNYLLQWEAIQRTREADCLVYDLWGAPETLDPSDSLWGVYRFKEGLGGQVVRHIGAWDLPIHPTIYRLYTQILPRVLDVMRRRKQKQTRRMEV